MLKRIDVMAPPKSAPQYKDVRRMIADVGGIVEPDHRRERDHRRRRPQHLHDRPQLLARDEWLAGTATPRLDGDGNGDRKQQRAEPEREEAALRAVAAPPRAEAQRVADRDQPDEQQQRDGDEVRRPRHFLSRPPFAIRSRCSISFSSTHLTYSAPLRKAGFRAPSSIYFFQSAVSVTFLRNPTYQSTASLGMSGAPKIPRSLR